MSEDVFGGRDMPGCTSAAESKLAAAECAAFVIELRTEAIVCLCLLLVVVHQLIMRESIKGRGVTKTRDVTRTR